MSVTSATTKGGKRKLVHSEFDDGYAIGYFDGCDYIPLLFCWDDVYGCTETAVLASSDLYHGRLMRTDGGLRVDDSEEVYTFDWHEMKRVSHSIPTENGTRYIDGYELNSASNTALEGVQSRYRAYSRANRFYWTPENVTQNPEGASPLFSLDQRSHRACPYKCAGQCYHDTFPEEIPTTYRVNYNGDELL